MTVNERSLATVGSSEFLLKLISPDDEERKPFVGGIVYDGKRKIVGIGVDSTPVEDKTFEERLFSRYADIPDDADIDALLKTSGRVVLLPDFSEIYVAQVGLGGVSVQGFDSLRTHPSVSVNIRYSDPQTPEKATEVFHMDEEEVLSLLTGEKGGIAMFHGMNRDEDNAFVFEKGSGDNKQGFVFFVHPTEKPLMGLNSVEGVKGVLTHLNKGFVDPAAGNYPLQTQALGQLEKELASGSLHFTSAVRQELFRSIVIAHARLATKTDDPKYRETLEDMLPNLRTGPLARIFSFIPSDRAEYIEAAINRIVGQINTPSLPAPEMDKNLSKEPPHLATEIIKKLKNKGARDLRTDLVGYFGQDIEKMYEYMNEVARMCEKAQSAWEFDDAFLLLREIHELPESHGIYAGEGAKYAKFLYRGWGDKTTDRRIFTMQGNYVSSGHERDIAGRKGIEVLAARTLAQRKLLNV